MRIFCLLAVVLILAACSSDSRHSSLTGATEPAEATVAPSAPSPQATTPPVIPPPSGPLVPGSGSPQLTCTMRYPEGTCQ
jgi:hypothetical protein